ncbi:hypothetical protein AC579_5568 [Pseudocercospora musae]|uniref:DOMON domain-containing protein n=1 Tax=Pseudocercospora musae TaxID=113226 RepID=A0A139I0V8_9PEZI|nr:hypothetical protein AC579_5568 [Pseudocercospora musae]
MLKPMPNRTLSPRATCHHLWVDRDTGSFQVLSITTLVSQALGNRIERTGGRDSIYLLILHKKYHLSYIATIDIFLHPLVTMLLSRSALSILGFAAPAIAQTGSSWIPFDQNQFNGNASLDTDGYVQLFWKTGDDYSTFGVASRSSGYLALGFSETGAMTGADIALAYSSANGSFIFENRHATGFVTPQVSRDQTSNIRFKEGDQANGVTYFIFEKRNTADCRQSQEDVAKDAWQWFIYAFSDQNNFTRHEPGHMGKQYVKLGTGKTVTLNAAREVEGTKIFTVVQPEVEIPSDETTYCYTLHKMPAGEKNFLIGESPPQSSPLLHHLVLYACYGLPDEYLNMIGKEPNCKWRNFSNPCNGFVTEWAPGMSARTFEPGYGKPFGRDLYEYAMLETHYNNPEGLVGEKDTATYEFLYTNQQVDTEIGTLTLGDMQVEGWFLEPGKGLVAHSTVCTPECTHHWPSDGITAVSVFHHMHYRGRNARVQIIRDGKEIAPLSTLHNFEYGYQFSKSLNSVKLLPGDKLITTCEYNTMNDTEAVPGGQSSEDEMCFAWVDYYPANSVLCCTQIDLGSSPRNSLNGTAAMCLESSAASPDIYLSDYLTSQFQSLPESGNNCSANSGTTMGGQDGQATILKTCPEADVCFSLNVPQQSASSGSGDIYFQISAPTKYSWVALAQGTMMGNANMFLMYSSADGSNVTVSSRTTSGHVMPTHNDAAAIVLLEGTGVSNGVMTANVRCSNCTSWSSGTMDLQSGSSSDWVFAHLKGSSLNSDDTNVAISKHDGSGSFQWEIAQATGGSSTNPFVSPGSRTTSGSSPARDQSQTPFIHAHGSLASIAFVAVFPIGGVLVRLGSLRGLAWIHGSIQALGYAIFIAAAGLGIFVTQSNAYLHEPHAIIGMLLLGLLFFMPLLGTVHHKMYHKVQKRTMWSYAHIATGRVVIILGMINGGLGLRLADADRSSKIAYGVFSGLASVCYISAVTYTEFRRARGPPKDRTSLSSSDGEAR